MNFFKKLFNKRFYVATLAFGGIVTEIRISFNFNDLVSEVEEIARQNHFCHVTDDIRIFDQDGVEVYSYPSDSEDWPE